MSKTAGTFLFNPVYAGTCRDNICDVLRPLVEKKILTNGTCDEKQ